MSTSARKSFAVDFKFCQSLGRLTDEKKAFRQWDVKLSNALDHARKGYGRILEHLRECITRGQDLEYVRPGTSPSVTGAVSGLT